MTADRRLLLVHAHPDDETITTGATMARYAADGVQVTLVTCTLGELGEIIGADLAELAADRGDQLGGYRMGELAAALRALGVSDQRYLGGPGRWRDSGMIATSGNEAPRAFWRCASDPAAFEMAVQQLAAVIREVRPQVLVTYDERGSYGHPDHIMAHRVALAAVDRAAVDRAAVDRAAVSDRAAASPDAWSVAKVYFTAEPSGTGEPLGTGTGTGDEPTAGPAGSVTTAIDADAFLDAKRAAMRAHATQITVLDPATFALSNDIETPLLGVEYFRLARGRLGDKRDPDGYEVDLFDGLDGVGA